jgi:Holliday junction resolvase
MSGAASRRKGHDFERLLVQRFRDAMPGAEVRRGVQSRSGAECADVEAPCFHIEAKRHRQTNIREAMRQAVETCPGGRWPIAVCKDDNQPALVTMQLEDFLDLVREWWEGRR